MGKIKKAPAKGAFIFGAPGTIRTCDLLVRSQVLYPAELRALRKKIHRLVNKKGQEKFIFLFNFLKIKDLL